MTSSFYFDEVANLSYSYANCGGADTFSLEQCATATDAASCGEMEQCVFEDNTCAPPVPTNASRQLSEITASGFSAADRLLEAERRLIALPHENMSTWARRLQSEGSLTDEAVSLVSMFEKIPGGQMTNNSNSLDKGELEEGCKLSAQGQRVDASATLRNESVTQCSSGYFPKGYAYECEGCAPNVSAHFTSAASVATALAKNVMGLCRLIVPAARQRHFCSFMKTAGRSA
jgi:hypothetical protein